jgi:hypothetical protein
MSPDPLSADDPGFAAAVEAAFREAEDFDELSQLHRVAGEGESVGGFRGLEEAASCHVLLGNVTTAVQLLNRVSKLPVRHDWQRSVMDHLERLRHIIVDEGCEAAVGELNRRASVTAGELGLVKRG